MKNLTYDAYITNSATREEIEHEARRARAEAVHRYIVLPLKAMFERAPAKTARLTPQSA